MDTSNGKLYESIDLARAAGAFEPVEIVGTPESVARISAAVRAQHKAKRKAQKKARKANR